MAKKNLQEEQLKRALADYQNLKKRVESERLEFVKYVLEQFLLKLLPVVDDLEAAEAHIKDQGLTLAVDKLKTILDKIHSLPQRINFLLNKRNKVLENLKAYSILNPTHLGFVVVIVYHQNKEKEEIIKYCEQQKLEYTECPRYIRVNQKAISIEIKRLIN